MDCGPIRSLGLRSSCSKALFLRTEPRMQLKRGRWSPRSWPCAEKRNEGGHRRRRNPEKFDISSATAAKTNAPAMATLILVRAR
jgi:hypothetical protein